MAGTSYNKPNRYDYVSRKVFDRQVDRLERKIAAVKAEIRTLEGHVAHHCDTLEDEILARSGPKRKTS